LGFGDHKNCTAHCGPNGLTVIPLLNQLWVGIANSSVCVVKLSTNTIYACIDTHGTSGVDELCYDARNKLVVVVNPDDVVPFITFINVVTQQIVRKISFPDATHGVEAPVWNSVDGLVYLSIPATIKNPGGEIKVINPKNFIVTKVIPLSQCNSKGIIFGNDGMTLFIECANKKPLHFVVINVSSGKTIYDIPGFGDGDEVDYDPNTDSYFSTPYSLSKLGRVLAIFQRGVLVQTIAVDKLSHTVAVDSFSGNVYIPLDKGIGIFVNSTTISL